MEPFFLVLHVLIAVALIVVVLIQRSSTDGFGLGSGSGSNFMSGRQAANLLTRATAILATMFILNSLWLGWVATHKDRASLTDRIEAASKAEKPASDATPDAKGEKEAQKKTGGADAAKDKPETSDKPAADADETESKTKPAEKDAAKKPAQAPAVPVAD